MLKVRVLGNLEVLTPDGRIVSPTGKRTRLLLAKLALCLGQDLVRVDLANTVWPECGPQEARRNLRQILFSLRQWMDDLMPGALRVDGESVWLDPRLVTTDLAEFQSATDVVTWTHAVSGYTGPLLAESDETWVVLERQRIETIVVEAIFNLVNSHFKARETTTALRYAELALKIDPLSERACYAVVRLCASLGQPGAAKCHYSAFESRLASELGVAPSVPLSKLVGTGLRPWSIGNIEAATEKPLPRRSRSHFLVASLTLGVLASFALAFALPQRVRPSDRELVAKLSSWSKRPPSDEMRRRQSIVLVELADRAFKDNYGSRESVWRAELDSLMPEINRVFEWCVQRDPKAAVRIGGALGRQMLLHGSQRQWGEGLLTALSRAPKEATRERANALVWCCFLLEPYRTAGLEELSLEALELSQGLGDEWLHAQAQRARGMVICNFGRKAESLKLFDQSLALCKRLDRRDGVALNLLCQGIIFDASTSDPASERERRLAALVASFDEFARLGNEWGIAFSAMFVANEATNLDLPHNSATLFKECRRVMLATAAFENKRGNPAASSACEVSALQFSIKLRNKPEIAEGLARAGANMKFSLQDRYMFLVAAERLDPHYAKSELAAMMLQSMARENPAAAAKLKALAHTMPTDAILAKIARTKLD